MSETAPIDHEAISAAWRARMDALPIIHADKPFSVTRRKRFSSYGRRPINEWGSGDLPAPFAEGDLLYLPEGAENDRLYGMGAGYFVVSCAFSIDDGDAWYFRVTNHNDRGSDRLHVGYPGRCTWPDEQCCDWMSGFHLVDTADPDGLQQREHMLAKGWTFTEHLDLFATQRLNIRALTDRLEQVTTAGQQLADALDGLTDSNYAVTHHDAMRALAAWGALTTEAVP